MHIRCERCRSEYDLDDSQVPDDRADVQCTVCGNVFAVAGRRGPAAPAGRRSSPQTMAVTVPNDEFRGSRARLSLADREDGGAGAHGALKIFVGLTVAAGVAFAGIQWQQGRIHSAAIGRNSGGRSAKTDRSVPGTLEANRDRGAGPAGLQVSGERANPSPASKGPVVQALPSPPLARTEDTAAPAAPPSPAVGRPPSYEKLIASGERALENGANGKAKELYQKALLMRPAAPDALAGLAFVALDRGQIPAAYELFKRALNARSSFGPALFGMAEIHRARGEKALALQSYQRYLQVSPHGKEAQAARRQIESLQGKR